MNAGPVNVKMLLARSNNIVCREKRCVCVCVCELCVPRRRCERRTLADGVGRWCGGAAGEGGGGHMVGRRSFNPER